MKKFVVKIKKNGRGTTPLAGSVSREQAECRKSPCKMQGFGVNRVRIGARAIPSPREGQVQLATVSPMNRFTDTALPKNPSATPAATTAP
jgi:hypothetical protein